MVRKETNNEVIKWPNHEVNLEFYQGTNGHKVIKHQMYMVC